MLDEGILLSVTKRSLLDNCKLSAAIKISVTAAHSEGDLLLVTSKLRDAVEKVLR
jgi:serine palmitoyltransferase